MLVHAKIFPHRRLNPDKGRVAIPDAPQPAYTPIEDRVVMRELIREEQAKQLARRAEMLTNQSNANRPTKSPPPFDVKFYFEPELVIVFTNLPLNTRKRASRVSAEVNIGGAMGASVVWLKRFHKKEQFFCSECGFEITATEKGTVPYEIVATGPACGPFMISGLCRNCHLKDHGGEEMWISKSRFIYKVLEPHSGSK